jgi:hypothetical protein
VRARAPYDNEPLDTRPAGRPDDGGRMLYASDVQEDVRATERFVEVGLVSGFAAEDLRVEPSAGRR